jgi:hypothetical protein
MAAATRAFRRHLTWTLIAAVLGAAILTGCDKQPDDKALAGELSQHVQDWLDHVGDPSTAKPACDWTDAEVQTTTAGSTPASDALACLQPTGNGEFSLRVRNLITVPITVWGKPAAWPATVQPNQTLDVKLVNPVFGAAVNYTPDPQAGVTTAVLDWLGDKARPGVKWTSCVEQPEQHCLIDLAPSLLPKEVKVGRWTVPAQQIAEVLATLWQQRSLMTSFADHTTGHEGGSLTLIRKAAA